MNSYNGFSPRQRLRALAWLKGEYAAGRRAIPERCDACGQTEGVIEPHSEDYSGPPYGQNIGAFGFCYRCHMMIHCRFRNPAAWDAYREAIREGKRFAPLHGRNFGEFLRQLNGKEVSFSQHDPPKVLILDNIHAGIYIPTRHPCK